MDKYKLEYHMKIKGVTRKELCEAIEISDTAFYRKCSGDSEFTRNEIEKIADTLDLSGVDILSIFFVNKVS